MKYIFEQREKAKEERRTWQKKEWREKWIKCDKEFIDLTDSLSDDWTNYEHIYFEIRMWLRQKLWKYFTLKSMRVASECRKVFFFVELFWVFRRFSSTLTLSHIMTMRNHIQMRRWLFWKILIFFCCVQPDFFVSWRKRNKMNVNGTN